MVGVGRFSGFARATISEAWNLFGIRNGVESLDALRLSIERYRRQPIEPLDDPEIGCVLLHDTVLFEPEATLPGFHHRVIGAESLVGPPSAAEAVIAETYGHHCAITGERVRPVLEAAHILPVSAGGQHRVDNGLLLRSDVHTLFDRGYIGVDTKYRLRVSPALRSQFGNGATPVRERLSTCPHNEHANRIGSFWNGTTTRYSSGRPLRARRTTR